MKKPRRKVKTSTKGDNQSLPRVTCTFLAKTKISSRDFMARLNPSAKWTATVRIAIRSPVRTVEQMEIIGMDARRGKKGLQEVLSKP
jgi:hypothetical protein